MESLEDLQKRTCFNKAVPNYTVVNGTVLGYKYNEIKDKIDNFEVDDTDIFVCTFPKAGTTWTQEMVWLLAHDFDYEGAKVVHDERFPYFEMEMTFDMDELIKSRGSVPEYLSNSIEFSKNLKTKPRCMKTHLPWYLLPKQIQNYERRPKIVYTIRDPRDTCNSFYHNYKGFFDFKGTFEEFSTLYMNDKILHSPFWTQVNSYWNQRNEPNVLILRYSDLKKDLRGEVLKLAKFLGKTIPDDQMDKYLKHLSFDSMKNNPACNIPIMKSNTISQGHFVRKGIIGDHKNTMSPETIEKFNKWIEENNKFGIEF